MCFTGAVNIPPDTNSENALQVLNKVICIPVTKQPDGTFIMVGQLNQANL